MKSSNTTGKRYSFFFRVLVPILLILLLFVIEIIDSGVLEKISGYLLIGICLAGFYAAWWYAEWKKSCPQCNCWSAKEVIEKQLIDCKETQSTITYETEVTDNTLKSTKFYEESSSYLKYLYHLKCKFCGHTWDEQLAERIDHKTRI